MGALEIIARFGQYGAVLALFGVAGTALYIAGAAGLAPLRRILTLLGAFAIVTCLAALPFQTAQMTGSLADAVKPDMLWLILSGTGYGVSWIVRVIVLVLALFAVRLIDSWPRLAYALVLLLSGIAAASLAWGGHGAMGEGLAGLFHTAADIVHLWAAGLWLGALAVFVLMILRPADAPQKSATRALAGFAGLGAFIVAALVLTGLINIAFLVPRAALGHLLASGWAVLLALKLGFFAAMIGLASTNRFVLTPRLTAALRDPARQPEAVRALRISLLTEFGAAIVVVGLVSWLGTLQPPHVV